MLDYLGYMASLFTRPLAGWHGAPAWTAFRHPRRRKTEMLMGMHPRDLLKLAQTHLDELRRESRQSRNTAANHRSRGGIDRFLSAIRIRLPR